MGTADSQDEFSALFAPEAASAAAVTPWPILIVDDDRDIHAALRLALHDVVVEGRPLQVLEAFSATEAKAILAERQDLALLLLDVVMETADAGLALVDHIRHECGDHRLRIVLLTGQPGFAPQREVVTHYEIDDFRLKSELSAERLYVSVYSALRTYRLLRDLERKQGVEQLADERRQANERLALEIAERRAAQDAADARLRELAAVNARLEAAHLHLLQSEKMASIGLLAAGVAHEINNPIGFVNSNLGTLGSYVRDLLAIIDAYAAAEAAVAMPEQFSAVAALKEQFELDYLREEILALLAESREGLERVKRIIQSLRDFSRTDASEVWREDDLQQGLESTLAVVWNELKYKCELHREYAPLPPVECVLSQLNQVFMNLLVNAAHAIEGVGVVTVRTGCDGDMVWVEVADTGSGIAPEHLSHIFDPFFTTKPVGKGTGLGLAISYGIVDKHHGRIEVDSEPGRGSRFRVWLPIRQPAASG